GSKIHLCHCQYEKDVIKYQGAQIHVLLIDELTHFTEKIYRYLRGRCRLGGLKVPERYRGLFPRIICGSNPGGVGHNWVKAAFIDIAPPKAITQMPPKEGGKRRQYIPAKLADNPSMAESDPDYSSTLEGLGSPELVRAMRDGDWDIVAGGMFDDLWSRPVHVLA
ncbi:terminase family protein, partial [Chromohalobacter sp. HP20-39]